jgi:hypothetical protein
MYPGLLQKSCSASTQTTHLAFRSKFCTAPVGESCPKNLNSTQASIMSTKTNPKHHDPQYQEIPADEAQHTKAGARGVRSGGNAGAMGDPVSDQSQHNYQVSRDTDMTQHADDAARHSQELEAARRREEIDEARMNKVHDV